MPPLRLFTSLLGLVILAITGQGCEDSHESADHLTESTTNSSTSQDPPASSLVQVQSGTLQALGRSFSPVIAPDLAPQAGLVEVELTAMVAEVQAIAGHPYAAWTYNQGTPGPTIRAQVGDRVRIIVHNQLPEPTSFEVHGLRSSWSPAPSLTEVEILPNQSMVFETVVEDPGTYFYRPRIRSPHAEQATLFGAFLVEDPQPPPAHRDEVLLFSDVAVDPNALTLSSPHETPTVYGPLGNLLLANGQALPVLSYANGTRLHLRVINAALARPLRLAIPGATITTVARDAARLPKPQVSAQLDLLPGERTDIVLDLPATPQLNLHAVALPHARTTPVDPTQSAPLFVLAADNSPAPPPLPAPGDGPAVPELPPATELRHLMITLDPTGALNLLDATGNPSLWTIRQATRETWTLDNRTAIDVPIHFGGNWVQIASIQGKTSMQREWRDTVAVPALQSVEVRVHWTGYVGIHMVSLPRLVGSQAHQVVEVLPADPTPPA